MRRKLCEFYRDRGYPQGETGMMLSALPGGVCYPAKVPDIPGLLAFLREKLPEYLYAYVSLEENGSGYAEVTTYLGEWREFDPDPTTALALAGKAALEVLDEH